MRQQGVPQPRQRPRGDVGRSRNAAELMTLTDALHNAGIQLELFTESMTGIYDPAGMGSMPFAVYTVAPPSWTAKDESDGSQSPRESQ